MNFINKRSTDTICMLTVATAIATGFMLHRDVHHLYIYNNELLWDIHEIAGMLFTILITIHCLQHKFWFKNYSKIKPEKKRVTTILAIVGVILLVTGYILLCGSHSNAVSITHYVSGIIFTLLAIGHVVKRWKTYVKLKILG